MPKGAESVRIRASLISAGAFFASLIVLAVFEMMHQPDALQAADNERVTTVALCLLLALGSSTFSVILGLRPLLQSDVRPLIWFSAMIAGWAFFLVYYDFASLG